MHKHALCGDKEVLGAGNEQKEVTANERYLAYKLLSTTVELRWETEPRIGSKTF